MHRCHLVTALNPYFLIHSWWIENIIFYVVNFAKDFCKACFEYQKIFFKELKLKKKSNFNLDSNLLRKYVVGKVYCHYLSFAPLLRIKWRKFPSICPSNNETQIKINVEERWMNGYSWERTSWWTILEEKEKRLSQMTEIGLRSDLQRSTMKL